MVQNLVLQSFGRESEYKRAILTITSYFAHTTLPLTNSSVLLFTDHPSYFTEYLNGLPIKYVTLTAEKIKEMRGSIDFLHRMKIAVIEEAFTLSSGNLLYADSDTFFTADPSPYMQQLASDKGFMHEWEYEFEELRNWKLPAGATFKAFLDLIETKKFYLAAGKEIHVLPQHASWNAGVMMFHKSHERFIPDVYALTDQFYPTSHNHASEQYAFSIIMQENTQLSSCEEVIYHYWYRVKKQVVDIFLKENLTGAFAKRPLKEKLKLVEAWSKILPGHLDNHDLMIKDKAIQAFNENKFKEGYQWAAKAILRKPFNSGSFLRDTFYHIKRHLTNK
jgi:hypothetical protein